MVELISHSWSLISKRSTRSANLVRRALSSSLARPAPAQWWMPRPKLEVVDRVARHVEAVGVFEASLVAVPRADQGDDAAVGRDADTADVDVVVGDPCVALDRRVVAKHLVDRRGDELGIRRT